MTVVLSSVVNSCRQPATAARLSMSASSLVQDQSVVDSSPSLILRHRQVCRSCHTFTSLWDEGMSCFQTLEADLVLAALCKRNLVASLRGNWCAVSTLYPY